jgi:rRNA maturation RNase YbeY
MSQFVRLLCITHHPESNCITGAIRAIPRREAQVRCGGRLPVRTANDMSRAILRPQWVRDWRGIDKPTNVLSFPASGHKGSERSRFLGDIVIAYETLVRECDDEDRKFLHHLAHLTVHGFLHLAGYDHETDVQAEEMEGLESKIMTRLSMPDPYIARDLGDA